MTRPLFAVLATAGLAWWVFDRVCAAICAADDALAVEWEEIA